MPPLRGVAQLLRLVACLGRKDITAHITARAPPTHRMTPVNAPRLTAPSAERGGNGRRGPPAHAVPAQCQWWPIACRP